MATRRSDACCWASSLAGSAARLVVPAFLSFEGTRADLTDEPGGERRDQEKNCDRHHFSDVGPQEAAARADMEVADMEVGVDGGAGQRHHRQPHSQPAEITSKPSRKTKPNVPRAAVWVSRSTTDASTMRSAPATTIPSQSGGLLVPSTADSAPGRGGRDLTLSGEIDCQRRAAALGDDAKFGIATLNRPRPHLPCGPRAVSTHLREERHV